MLNMTHEQGSFDGRIAVVTGAKGHLGGTVSEVFLQHGMKVVGADISVESRVLEADGDRDDMHWMYLDGAQPDTVDTLVDAVEDDLGPIDYFVNCAGGFRWTLIGDASDADIGFLVDANLKSALFGVRAVLPKMKERGRGRILLMSSKSTLNPSKGEGPYTATKAALNALTKSVADEVKTTGVTINAILPTVIDTPTNREDMPDADFENWVKREQIADLMLDLLGPTGDPINGALIPISGGM
jgi:NAD(P)-dependent dehydrogenase (short-subunit alcohol dehydrogenase family)